MTPFTLSRNVPTKTFTYSVCFIFLSTLLLCWVLTLANHHFPEQQSLPSLSQCANSEPERSIFALGITISSCGFAIVAYLRFLYLALLLRLTTTSGSSSSISNGGSGRKKRDDLLSPGKRARTVNVLSFLNALVMIVLMALAACFDSSHYAAHQYFAYIFFFLNVVYQLAHAWLQRQVASSVSRVQLRNARALPSGGVRILTRPHAKSVLFVFTAVAAVIAFLLKVSDAGYSAVAVFEYMLTLSIWLFWMSIGADFYLFRASLLAKIGVQSGDDRSRVINIEDV